MQLAVVAMLPNKLHNSDLMVAAATVEQHFFILFYFVKRIFQFLVF
jgi:hypothetical protein